MGPAQLAIAIASLALQFGVPLAIDLAKLWKDALSGKEPTKEDWQALRAMVPAPETYSED
jgi:hypothetical protein